MRELLKKVVDFIAKKLEGPELPVNDPLDTDESSNWNVAVVEHPQYWVETNYVEAKGDNPIVKALTKKTVIDVMQTVHRNAVQVMFDCMRIQLKSTIGFEDGAWRAWVKDGHMCVEVILHKPETLALLTTACTTAAENIRTHGIKFEKFPVQLVKHEESEQQRAMVDIPVRNVQVDIGAPLMWMVLHHNKERPIVWDKKLWLPK